jgi:hypothetical protein
MSIASEVYTQLGEQAVEEWTSLRKRYFEVKEEMETGVDELERDKLLKEIASLGRAVNKIEEEAGINPKNRTS